MIVDPLDLLHLQLELECKGVRADGLLYRIPCDNPDDIPRVFIANHAAGWTVYFRHDLAPSLLGQLRALPAEQLWADVKTVQTMLAESGTPSEALWRGSTYYFPRSPAPQESPDVTLRDGAFVVLQEGEPVSWAWSARTNDQAAELAVETKPTFRRRGFARQVAAAWARQQLMQQKIAFYSHLHDNLASRALAESLGVVHVMDVIAYG